MRFALFAVCVVAFAQDPPHSGLPTDFPKEEHERKLPNGKVQAEEILKADHAKSLEDLRQISELSQSLLADMERDTSHVLSLSSIKKIDEIDKLARRVKSRMRRF